jgi:hypothetical protein
MEATKCLKPSDSGSRSGDRASVQAASRQIVSRCAPVIRSVLRIRIALDQAVDDLGPASERRAVHGASPFRSRCTLVVRTNQPKT